MCKKGRGCSVWQRLKKTMLRQFSGVEDHHVDYAHGLVSAGASDAKAVHMTYGKYSRGVRC